MYIIYKDSWHVKFNLYVKHRYNSIEEIEMAIGYFSSLSENSKRQFEILDGFGIDLIA